MTMTYDGTMVMPSKFVVVEQNEMTYLEGGAVSTYKGSAKQASAFCAGLMTAWWSLATGYGYTAATTAATAVGLPVSAIAGVGTAYCSYVASQYTGAYNACQKKTIGNKNPTTYVDTYTFLSIVTGVEVR